MTSRDGRAVVELHGDWLGEQPLPTFDELRERLGQASNEHWQLQPGADFRWDSQFMTRLFQCALYCQQQGIALDVEAMPEGVRRLLAVATAVKPLAAAPNRHPGFFERLRRHGTTLLSAIAELLGFVGGVTLALVRFCTGRANTRVRDIWYFIDQCGPQALGIVALISVLVGMILAYLGSVQLRQFGAEVYVANLVTLGMVREMGALMTAVIMAGRTGAAYAAQLGAMQSNEEIDAITTLGISPMEYLVLPRMLALVAVMPLLCILANILGMLGGAMVAAGMDISLVQFINQSREAVTVGDVASGVFKSLVFGVLIATAGCQAGLQSGRSSAAVGQATTRAVVNAIVYLVVADAALNIIYDKLGI